MLEVTTKANESQTARSKTPKETVGTHQALPTELSYDDDLIVEVESQSEAPIPVGCQPKVPVIIGEVHYRGMMPVDGMLVGRFDNNQGSLEVRQDTQSEFFSSGPQLTGEFSFVDLVEVNGHIAGQVVSKNGTLVVNSEAAVDANVDVAVAIIRGTVNGDIVAQQRVELSEGARVSGNICTGSITVEGGATFDGLCTML